LHNYCEGCKSLIYWVGDRKNVADYENDFKKMKPTSLTFKPIEHVINLLCARAM